MARIALVTGSNRGLGRDMALQLARSGHDLIITYRSHADEAQRVVEEIRALGRTAVAVPLDVARIATFPAFTAMLHKTVQERWQRASIDVLVNNAGINVYCPFSATSEAQFDDLMNVHFKGAYFLTQSLLPMIADDGRIVCVSTGLTRFAVPGYAAYAAMKGAIEVMVKYLAKELGPRRIAVNAVAPGAIETDFTSEALSHPGMREFVAAQTALGRVGQPSDIGGVVAFLCSPAGAWVNAQRIEASGGMFL
jgi:NAD(P)-dependent dehydrogenase (short-subunit alcohol dehydrogenase family)